MSSRCSQSPRVGLGFGDPGRTKNGSDPAVGYERVMRVSSAGYTVVAQPPPDSPTICTDDGRYVVCTWFIATDNGVRNSASGEYVAEAHRGRSLCDGCSCLVGSAGSCRVFGFQW